MKVDNARALFVCRNVLAYGVEQMRLAEADAAVKKKRL